VKRWFQAVALVGAALLSSCGALEPYDTTPGPPPSTPKSAGGSVSNSAAATSPRVGVCYNTLTTTLAEIRAQAQQQCAAGTIAEPVDTDWYLQHCPLLLPARATFACIPQKQK
jgi:hypothetical protein